MSEEKQGRAKEDLVAAGVAAGMRVLLSHQLEPAKQQRIRSMLLDACERCVELGTRELSKLALKEVSEDDTAIYRVMGIVEHEIKEAAAGVQTARAKHAGFAELAWAEELQKLNTALFSISYANLGRREDVERSRKSGLPGTVRNRSTGRKRLLEDLLKVYGEAVGAPSRWQFSRATMKRDGNDVSRFVYVVSCELLDPSETGIQSLYDELRRVAKPAISRVTS